jgi:hypothetical protein
MNAAAAVRVASRIGRPNTDRDENWMVQATRSSRGSQRALVDAQFVRELIERQQHAVARVRVAGSRAELSGVRCPRSEAFRPARRSALRTSFGGDPRHVEDHSIRVSYSRRIAIYRSIEMLR